MAIKRNCPIDRGSFISGYHAVGMLSGVRDTEVAPKAIRLSIEKVDRLHLSRGNHSQEEIAYGADIFNINDDPVHGYSLNLHSVNGFAGKGYRLVQSRVAYPRPLPGH